MKAKAWQVINATYGRTYSCPYSVFVETEGQVTVPTQVNCKWVVTSGLQFATWLHMSTNRRLPGLTVAKQQHTHTHTPQTSPALTRGPGMRYRHKKGRDGLHMATNHSLRKAKRMEPWRESAWQRQEASGMLLGFQPDLVMKLLLIKKNGQGNIKPALLFVFLPSNFLGQKFIGFPWYLEVSIIEIEGKKRVLTTHSSKAALFSAY